MLKVALVRALLVVLVLAFAGCSAREDPPAPTPAPSLMPSESSVAPRMQEAPSAPQTPSPTPKPEPPSIDPWTRRPIGNGCDTHGLHVDVPQQWVQRVLPENYTAHADLPGIAQVRIDAHFCASLVLDNFTVVRDAAFAFFWVAAMPRDPAHKADSGLMMRESYLFHAWAEDQRIVDALREVGIDARLANISKDSALGFRLELTSGEDRLLFTSGTAADPQPFYQDSLGSRFFFTPGYEWFEVALNISAATISGEPGALAFEGTLLEQVIEQEVDAWLAYNSHVTTSLLGRFGKP